MKNYIKFPILVISIFFASWLFYGCCGCGNYKYTISDPAGHIFRTNQITPQSGCIKFVDESSDNKNPITLCGGYTIEENKTYKPEKK